jgi:hypothetical protein
MNQGPIAFNSKVKNKYLWKIALSVLIVILSGCATTYSSLKGNSTGSTGYELIIAAENDVLDAAYDAIQNRFPGTIISTLAGKERGFTFYTQPALDRTTYKFLVEKATATIEDGKTVTGYYYSIYAQGTQFFVESRYVEPLIQEFKRMLKKKGVTLMLVQAVKFER